MAYLQLRVVCSHSFINDDSIDSDYECFFIILSLEHLWLNCISYEVQRLHKVLVFSRIFLFRMTRLFVYFKSSEIFTILILLLPLKHIVRFVHILDSTFRSPFLNLTNTFKVLLSLRHTFLFCITAKFLFKDAMLIQGDSESDLRDF